MQISKTIQALFCRESIAWLLSGICATVVAVLPASAQAPMVSISHGEAMTLAPEVLATRAAGPYGALYAEVTRPYFNPRDEKEEVWSLTFATRPRGTIDPGLCEAGRLEVDLRRHMPVQPFKTTTVYRVFGDTTPGAPWSSFWSKTPDSCRYVGPVIWSGRLEDEDRPVFFTADGDERWVWRGVRGLRLAFEAMRANPVATPCDIDQPIGYDCDDLRRFGAAGHTDQLRRLDMVLCNAEPQRLCVEAWLHLAERSGGDQTLIVNFDIAPSFHGGDVRDLRNLKISKPMVIYD